MMVVAMTEDQCLTPQDIARELKVSVSTVKRWIRRKELACIQAGRLYRVERSALEQWKHEHYTTCS